MSAAVGLINRSRLRHLPNESRLSHEYCFFLHDQCVQLLKQYESAKAHHVTTKFSDNTQKELFIDLAKSRDTVTAMREVGFIDDARRVVLNTITMSMVSDCMHHIYEALMCLEKRKFVVALGLLRKPLMDSLTYLSWILGDEEDFYSNFSVGDAKLLAPDKLSGRRSEFITKALAKTSIGDLVKPNCIHSAIFDLKANPGFYGYFQHAVHLITTWKQEIKTTPENFNFIFKSPNSYDIFYLVSVLLPTVMLYLSHIILELFDNITKMDRGAKLAFIYRSRLGIYFAHGGEANNNFVVNWLKNTLPDNIVCGECEAPLKITKYNSARIVLRDSFRCTRCGRTNGIAFSWMF